MIAINGFLSALEYTKYIFGRGPAWAPLGKLTALPRPPSWLKGDLLLRGGEAKERRGRGKGRGK